MENKVRFRNHFSIVFQHMKGLLWVFAIAIFSGIASGDAQEIIAPALIWGTVGVVLVIWRIIIWAKTWITIGEQTIVMECNTLFSKKKHTIGIANISNVNLEQSLLGMLLGTCKLKLDTNSLSTAETTDVTIVLKKARAEEVKGMLLRQIEGEIEGAIDVETMSANVVEAGGEAQREAQEATSQYEVQRNVAACTRISTKDVLLHGFYSSRFLYAIFLPLFILLELVSDFAGEEDLEAIVDEVGSIAAETIGLGLLILIAVIAWRWLL